MIIFGLLTRPKYASNGLVSIIHPGLPQSPCRDLTAVPDKDVLEVHRLTTVRRDFFGAQHAPVSYLLMSSIWHRYQSLICAPRRRLYASDLFTQHTRYSHLSSFATLSCEATPLSQKANLYLDDFNIMSLNEIRRSRAKQGGC